MSIIALILLGILVFCILNTNVMAQGEPYILTMEEAEGLDADCVLVLGAKIYESGVLSATLEDRMAVGIEAYEAGAGRVLLLSGDHGSYGYDEVNAMKNYALSKGVEGDHIFLDHAGFCTYDSMVRAKEVFGAKKVLIVTQSFHLYRAVYIARSIGLEAYGVSSDLRPYVTATYNEVREFIARVKDSLWVLFRPDPKYLGDPIDLSGSGTVTWDSP